MRPGPLSLPCDSRARRSIVARFFSVANWARCGVNIRRDMHPLALVPVLVLVLAGCGGGSEGAAPPDWCHFTSRIVYVLDQHSTTLTSEELSDWEESTPEEVEPHVTDAAAVLRRYPVDANAPDLVAPRREIENFAEDRCG